MSAQRTSGMKRAVDAIQQRVRKFYSTDNDFHRSSGVACAYYTIRRTFDHGQPAPTFETLMMIAQAAGFRPAEVRELLKLAGDKRLHLLIGGDSEAISEKESALLRAIRKTAEVDPRVWGRIVDSLELSAKAAGVDISMEANTLAR